MESSATVQVVIPPIGMLAGVQVNLDLEDTRLKLREMENLVKDWDLRIKMNDRSIGRVQFSAMQFFADGVERRTITLKFIQLNPEVRGTKKSYSVLQFVLDTVGSECDAAWGKVAGRPVLFVERRHLSWVDEQARQGIFNYMRKIGERLLGIEHRPHPVPSSGLVITAIGDDVSMQLIAGYLERSGADTNTPDDRELHRN